MPKDNIRDYLEGNELDLSLNNLSAVPVKELASIPKATHLDLSCNVLTSLPDPFCNLNHLVKIDLSKNNLSSLPARFGNLTHLQHLDLLGNQLKILPLSFCHLQKLKWLDLKDNPLDTGLKKAAGDCLDETQCRQCAKNVLVFMKNANSEAERQKQKRLQEEREKEAARKKKEEEEQLKKKAEKKAEKERRRLQHQAKRDLEKKETQEEFTEKLGEPELQNGPSRKTEARVPKKSCLWGCCFWFFTLLVLLVAVVFGAHFYCKENKAQEVCKVYYEPAKNFTIVNYNCTKSHISVFLESQFGKNPVSDFLTKRL